MVIRVHAHWSALLPIVFGTACSDPVHPPVSPNDEDGSITSVSGTMGTQGSDAGDAGGDSAIPAGACTNLMPATEVKATYSVTPKPDPLGGTITDGTYHVKSLVIYAGQTPTVYSSTER